MATLKAPRWCPGPLAPPRPCGEDTGAVGKQDGIEVMETQGPRVKETWDAKALLDDGKAIAAVTPR